MSALRGDAVVDTHVHVTSADTRRYPRTEPAPGATWFVDRPLDVNGLLRDMDEAGVAKAVVVQGLGPYAFDNRYLLDAVPQDLARLAAVVAVDPTDPAAPATMARLAKHPYVRAVRLPAGTARRSDWLSDARADRVWRAAADLRLSLVLWVTEDALAELAAVVSRHPDVPVALDHCGGATFRRDDDTVAATALLAFVPLEHVLLKVTTAVLDVADALDDPAPLGAWLAEHFGSRRLMWGSNHPASGGRSYREMRDLLERAVARLASSARTDVRGATAARLYRLG
ncbi:MAG: amidohydrolase family protein [Chloroflexota bacterium]|nr:amidohydrolase family protein [Chloroflexota bacterium]